MNWFVFVPLPVSKSYSYLSYSFRITKTQKLGMETGSEISGHQQSRRFPLSCFWLVATHQMRQACIVADLLHLHDYIPHRWPAFTLYGTTGLAAWGRVKYCSTSSEIFCDFETEAIGLRSQNLRQPELFKEFIWNRCCLWWHFMTLITVTIARWLF